VCSRGLESSISLGDATCPIVAIHGVSHRARLPDTDRSVIGCRHRGLGGVAAVVSISVPGVVLRPSMVDVVDLVVQLFRV
jgi:hypothetical protein